MEVLGHKRKPEFSYTSVPIFCEPGWVDKRELLRREHFSLLDAPQPPRTAYKHPYPVGEKEKGQTQATFGDRGRPSKVWRDNTRL